MKKLSRHDFRVVLLVAMYVVVAWTLELYFVVFAKSLAARTDVFARMWEIYSSADHAYYDRVTREEYGLESFHILFTQWLHIWLIWAIVKHVYYRHTLQLIVGSYVCY